MTAKILDPQRISTRQNRNQGERTYTDRVAAERDTVVEFVLLYLSAPDRVPKMARCWESEKTLEILG
jgi:hypothetical protein